MPQTHGETRSKLGSLEIGRFIAALMVMLSHVVPYVNGHAAEPSHLIFGGLNFPGPLGVQYFFVLSGFVMASVHYGDFGKNFAPLTFWWRRACRIYPAYWLALCIPAYYLFGGMTPAGTLHLALLDPWRDREFIPAAWSMRYEMAFYLMFGLCLLPYVGRPLLGFWIFFTLWRYGILNILHLHPPVLFTINRFAAVHGGKFVDVFDFYFFAGVIAGLAYAGLRPGPRLSAALLAVALLGLACVLPREHWGVDYGIAASFRLSVACAVAGCVLGLALLERHGIIRLGKYAAWAGAMSYPIYIFHEPMLLVINETLPWGQHHPLSLYARFAAITAAILATAALVTFGYDQPVQRLLRRLRKKEKGQGALPPGPPPGAEPLDLNSLKRV